MNNKTKILKILIQNEKSTGELCRELDYVKNGKPRYNIIQGDLNTLYNQNYLKRKTKNKTGGRPGKFWKIKKNPIAILKLFINYPDLKEHIITTPWILDLIATTIIKSEPWASTKHTIAKDELIYFMRLSPGTFYALNCVAIKPLTLQLLAENYYIYTEPFIKKEKNKLSWDPSFILYDLIDKWMFNDLFEKREDKNFKKALKKIRIIKEKRRLNHAKSNNQLFIASTSALSL